MYLKRQFNLHEKSKLKKTAESATANYSMAKQGIITIVAIDLISILLFKVF